MFLVCRALWGWFLLGGKCKLRDVKKAVGREVTASLTIRGGGRLRGWRERDVGAEINSGHLNKERSAKIILGGLPV